ncbi:hypothetical protein Xen7305DRAFT_00010240 [Xenococcus sp. PCC 7305]|uniref:hypothetical protein n=1 Tax=Xenococcus sp. PCC 7305 TaxID=102125 RepID=UPI0002AC4D9D|nr:hypothetical protein [Xenococcus sp. PCC 7305]ELS01321.1 hypothetical protein Xen7305DRAFT_00010240 [Xenococcus sp. PCC 7305]
MFAQSKNKKYRLEYSVKFRHRNSKEILETKAYIYADSNPKTAIPKLFPGLIVASYELTGERIEI